MILTCSEIARLQDEVGVFIDKVGILAVGVDICLNNFYKMFHFFRLQGVE